jgi:hypothetical protein
LYRADLSKPVPALAHRIGDQKNWVYPPFAARVSCGAWAPVDETLIPFVHQTTDFDATDREAGIVHLTLQCPTSRPRVRIVREVKKEYAEIL